MSSPQDAHKVPNATAPQEQLLSPDHSYNPQREFDLILPTGPTDIEKYSYLKTNRLLLYVFGFASFLTLSAGMWLFVVSYVAFYWLGFFLGLLQIYLIISYAVSLCGKDYDFEAHKQVLKDYPILPETCPTVDVYLPCCKEPLEILENTYKHVKALEYPEGKLKVYVMDDGAMDEVKALAEKYGFNYLVRDDRPRLKKAGNLRWTFARTDGDFFNIYDADFCPRPDFLLETIPEHMADPKTCIIQTPQFFRVSPEQTWVEQGAGAVQELFYRVVEVNRNRWGASICVGSNAVYRRAALEEVGGTAEIGFSEDVHTGFGGVDRGWKVKYMPLCLACGVCPDNPRAFFSQQMRWCMGSTTLLTNPEFWHSRLSWVQKVCYLCGMMYYSAMALSIFLSPLPGVLLLWFRPEFFRYYNLAFAAPSVIYGLAAFHLWAKASYGVNVQYIMVIQSFAYLNALKDKLFGQALQWAPSGDNKAHKNNKYRNMRILCCLWMFTVTGFMAAGMGYRIVKGLKWYNCVPLICLQTYNLFVAHRFMFWSG
ncbi:glycosyltransferase family 2 protein [Myriangium duriaei CBS 260.36]|uniref:Glycosyltransferase family 2 protein n=1 Tax=Myriangium duriaei CBS 260.36 TaxID=1168546 RepID=A0A9P4MHY3_9PEZI|nr:glycosyltransferase family 2 protein [Myriangium duriaei CBS 260.36]